LNSGHVGVIYVSKTSFLFSVIINKHFFSFVKLHIIIFGYFIFMYETCFVYFRDTVSSHSDEVSDTVTSRVLNIVPRSLGVTVTSPFSDSQWNQAIEPLVSREHRLSDMDNSSTTASWASVDHNLGTTTSTITAAAFYMQFCIELAAYILKGCNGYYIFLNFAHCLQNEVIVE